MDLYEPVIQKSIDYWTKKVETVKTWNRHGLFVRLLEEEFPDIFYHSTAYTDLSASVKVDTSKQVLELLTWLRTKGYRSTGFRDEWESKYRRYEINEMGKKNVEVWSSDITLFVYFNDGGRCEFVEVGTKTIEAVDEHDEPVFGFRCEGEPVPVEA